jgi:16S rRNA (cytidine1402-2'-O)-methyltransferase
MPAYGRLFLIPNLLGVVAPQTVLPQRTIDIARGLTHFVVETPKAARAFIKALQPHHLLQEITLSELSEHTARDSVEALLAPAFAGHDLGLISDAGCPGVADPGALLVNAAHRAGVQVVPLVGPSAVLLALMASGMNGQSFAFHGYLAVQSNPRMAQLKSLDDAATRNGATQLFIETPYRNEAMREAVLSACRSTTQFAIAVDLTLPSEQVASRTIAEWRKAPRLALARRPVVFLLGRSE